MGLESKFLEIYVHFKKKKHFFKNNILKMCDVLFMNNG